MCIIIKLIGRMLSGIGVVFPYRHRIDRKNILVIAAGSIEQTLKKGVVQQLRDYSCGNYFNRLIFYNFNVDEPLCKSLSHKVEVIETGPVSHLKIVDFVYYFLFAVRLIRQSQINLIRVTDPYYRGLMGFFLSRLFHIPFCISVHADYDKRYELDGARGAPVVFGSRKLAKKMEQFLFSKGDLVLPIRESLIPCIEKAGVAKDRIKVIPHGLHLDDYVTGNPAHINVYDEFGIDRNKKIVSFAGRLSKENYVYDIVEIADKLKKLRKDETSILMAGYGVEEECLKSEIKSRGLQEYIRLIGPQPQALVATLRLQSYIGLSLMGGFSLIEACVAGRPVLSYDVEWHYELIKDGVTGYLVPEGDVQQVVDKIVFLLENPAIADEYGKSARKLVLEKHSLDEANKKKIEAYDHLYQKIRVPSGAIV